MQVHLSVLITIGLLSSFVFAENRPNILLIMADDMGYSDIGCYGGEIQTPNLDRLAAEGVRFTQFYNNAKCTTTRASLLSGMYPRGDGDVIPLHMPTLGEVMRIAGYQTGMSGKWHLGSIPPQRPVDRGFDEYYGLMDGCCNFFNPAIPDPTFKSGKVRVFGHNDKLVTEFPPNYYTTDAFAEHAAETIRRFHEVGKPFFIHLAFTAPHYPLHALPEDIAKYRGRYQMGWEELRRQRHSRQVAMGLLNSNWELSPTDPNAYDWNSANQDWEDLRMATYAAMVDRMDQNIGTVLATLKALNIEQDTVVIFLSDNGGCSEEPGGRDDSQSPGVVSAYTAVGPSWGWAQNTPFRHYKSWANEGGISTPLIVRWPRMISVENETGGKISTELGHIIDLLPTCLDLANATYPETFNGELTAPVEGRSLLPVLRGGTRATQTLFWEWAGNCAVRQGKWKLVWDNLNPSPQWELYDMLADRTELHNLAEMQPVRVASLQADYETWANATGRVIPRQKDRY